LADLKHNNEEVIEKLLKEYRKTGC
jgi:hypothetical protein